MTETEIDVRVDASGLACPMPLLRAKQALHQMGVGQVLEVKATDAGSVRDFKAYAELSGNELISTTEIGNLYVHLMRRG